MDQEDDANTVRRKLHSTSFTEIEWREISAAQDAINEDTGIKPSANKAIVSCVRRTVSSGVGISESSLYGPFIASPNSSGKKNRSTTFSDAEWSDIDAAQTLIGQSIGFRPSANQAIMVCVRRFLNTRTRADKQNP